MFSQTQEYALRAVIWLAGHRDNGPIGNGLIAAGTQVSESYLSKVLQALTKSGILVSKRGVGGGFMLDHDPGQLTVLDVMNAVDPMKRIDTCPLGLKTHGTNLCPMHARLNSAMSLVEEALASSTIQELKSEPGRPQPMVETPKKQTRKKPRR
jgi:Rrf2 family protein